MSEIIDNYIDCYNFIIELAENQENKELLDAILYMFEITTDYFTNFETSNTLWYEQIEYTNNKEN